MPSPIVLIVGAGPVGLTTALSLQQGGIRASDILVVDQRPSRDLSSSQSKALSVSASSLEVFRVLGIAERFLGAGLPLDKAHFGGAATPLALNYEVLGTRYPFNMIIPQLRTESILLQRCDEVGIAFAWGRKFIGLTQDGDEVSATFEVGEITETTRVPWLIGCDGTGSAVRQAVGIAFEGARATRHGWIADGHADEDAPTMANKPCYGPEGGRAMMFATEVGKTGRRFVGNFPPASSGLAVGQRLVAPDLEYVREWAVRNFGTHYNFHDLTWASVVGDGMRIAASYRAGRVFVAGDAAHQLFPAGGQGMNTGLLDAVNLAWKLAMVATGKAGTNRDVAERLLDSYSKERLAAVKAVRHNVQMQMTILQAGTEKEKAGVDFMEEALNEPTVNQRWARRVCGFADPVEPYQLAYSGLEKADELVGTRLTHISDANTDDVLEAAQTNRFVIGFVEGSVLAKELRHSLEQALRSIDRAEHVGILEKLLEPLDPKWKGVTAVLIRPDLRVTWVGREGSDVSALLQAFTKVVQWWLGKS